MSIEAAKVRGYKSVSDESMSSMSSILGFRV